MQTLTSSKRVVILLFLFSSSLFFSFAESPDPVRGSNGMVVSASDLASKVGLDILKKGGTAVDAAVATGFALAVTYPSAGNIGGGGFMVIHLSNGKDISIDYREKAPLKAYLDMYLDKDGKYIPELSSEGVTSSGVPGSVAGLLYVLEKYGTMKLKDVIQPAITIAEKGFILDYRTSELFKSMLSEFSKYPSSMKIFSKDGMPYAEGELFKQPDLAKTLKLIRDKGIKGFYKGKTAGLLVKQIQENSGYIIQDDLDKYKVVEREPVKGTYRGYEIVSMPPPSSGGIALIELLNILENYTFTKVDWGSSNYIHKMVEAMKYAYADRTVHLGDEDFYKVPKKWLLSKEHAKEIFNKITDEATPSSEITAGTPVGLNESKETTHYSVYDKFGNAVSTTTTLNSSFGNKIVVDGAGFLLNNEMDDFSAKPGEPNIYGLHGSEANSIQPEKRMLSSMSPTIVLKDGKPFIVIGSPGGSTIITVVLQVIMNVLDFGMNISQAVSVPRFHHQWLPDEIWAEDFALSSDVKNRLGEMGYKFGTNRSLGRAEGIMIDNIKKIIYGESDPRGNGSAEGY